MARLSPPLQPRAAAAATASAAFSLPESHPTPSPGPVSGPPSTMPDTYHAITNGIGWIATIRDQLAAVNADPESDDARAAIEEAPLDIAVRSDWQPLSTIADPVEFYILLSTGGPALRILGDLDHGSPCRSRLQYQDWGIPWTDHPANGADLTEALDSWAGFFYFGD